MDPLEHAERDYARYLELSTARELSSLAEDPTKTYAWQNGILSIHMEALIAEVRRLRALQTVAAA